MQSKEFPQSTLAREVGRLQRCPPGKLALWVRQAYSAPTLLDTAESASDGRTVQLTDMREVQRSRSFPDAPNCWERFVHFAALYAMLREKVPSLPPLECVKGGYRLQPDGTAMWVGVPPYDGRHIAAYIGGHHVRLAAQEVQFPPIAPAVPLNDASTAALGAFSQGTLSSAGAAFGDFGALGGLTAADRPDREWGNIGAGIGGGAARGALDGLAQGGWIGALVGLGVGAVSGGINADKATVAGKTPKPPTAPTPQGPEINNPSDYKRFLEAQSAVLSSTKKDLTSSVPVSGPLKGKTNKTPKAR